MTPQELSKLVVYKYCGSDSSWTYKYLLSPWAEFWVGYMPTTVAPNLITLSGLIFSLITFFSTVIYNPTFGPDGPRWIAAMTAVNLFIYQTLDNMDGKQVIWKAGLGLFIILIYCIRLVRLEPRRHLACFSITVLTPSTAPCSCYPSLLHWALDPR
jgi:hypothetical protein